MLLKAVLLFANLIEEQCEIYLWSSLTIASYLNKFFRWKCETDNIWAPNERGVTVPNQVSKIGRGYLDYLQLEEGATIHREISFGGYRVDGSFVPEKPLNNKYLKHVAIENRWVVIEIQG